MHGFPRWPAASLVVALVTLAACVAGSGRPAAGTTPDAGVERWTGTFKQATMAASSVVGPATPNKSAAYGSIAITPTAGDPRRFDVEVSISAPVEPNTQLAWAMYSGPCGTPSPPVGALTDFPAIEVTSGGGSVRVSLVLPLDRMQSYHASVYWGSRPSGVSNVMMCANLVRSS